MNREQAYEILHKYMKGERYLQHSYAVEAIMRGLAKKLAPDDVEYWGIAGLLHDLDEEQCDWQNDLSVHGPTSVEILKKEGVEDQVLFGGVEYPITFGDNVWDLFRGIDFTDLNGDGNSDVTMKFNDGGTEIKMVWFWDAESELFVYQPEESQLGQDEG